MCGNNFLSAWRTCCSSATTASAGDEAGSFGEALAHPFRVCFFFRMLEAWSSLYEAISQPAKVFCFQTDFRALGASTTCCRSVSGAALWDLVDLLVHMPHVTESVTNGPARSFY